MPQTAEPRPKFSANERIQRTQAVGEFAGGQAAFPVEPPEEILRGPLPFPRIAFQAGGDQVAVGIAPRLRAWHHMIQAPYRWRELAQTVKARAALPRVDGLPKRLGLHEIDLF